jgi:hypothetical protein
VGIVRVGAITSSRDQAGVELARGGGIDDGEEVRSSPVSWT